MSTIVLIDVSTTGVWFEVTLDNGSTRDAYVVVGSGASWHESTRFPNNARDTGASTGDAALDEAIRTRAGEELVRLTAATRRAA